MIDSFWQYQLPLWVVAFLFLILLLVPMELGFRFGVRRKSLHPSSEGEAASDVTLTSMLALLGLMLAFTYSFSMSRADLRKVALVDEVNAIGTAFLRADLLPEPGRSRLRQLLSDYARSRYVEPGTVRTLGEVQKVVAHSVEIQSKLWPTFKSALRDPGDLSYPEKALLISAVNEVLDCHTRRIAIFYDRLPTAVLGLLVLVAAASLSMAAYSLALRGQFNRLRMTAFALVLTSLMFIILDYDMAMRGLIQVDHRSLVVLIDEMRSAIQR